MTLTPGTGALEGFRVMPLDTAKLEGGLHQCEAVPVHYGMGDKAPEPFSFPPNFHAIDCSGFARWVIFHATGGDVLMPDGSYVQSDWCEQHGFKKTDYANAANHDGHVRIAFHHPGGRGGDGTGHVWIILNGMSLESYGGHGPGSRSYSHQWFLDHVDACYVVS